MKKKKKLYQVVDPFLDIDLSEHLVPIRFSLLPSDVIDKIPSDYFYNTHLLVGGRLKEVTIIYIADRDVISKYDYYSSSESIASFEVNGLSVEVSDYDI
jgi:hypothetical protein